MSGLDTLKICGAAMICLVALMSVRNLREGFSPLLRAASTLLFSGLCIVLLSPLVSFCRDMITKGGVEKYGEIIFKALGVAYLTHITSLVCRDCGEESLSASVETVGKTELLILAIPLISEVVRIAGELLSW